jgi:hypothetical protein
VRRGRETERERGKESVFFHAPPPFRRARAHRLFLVSSVARPRSTRHHPQNITKTSGEPGCPRCSRRSLTEPTCLGKTDCGRCGAARGRFCRGCLWARYGEELDDVRARASRGEWVCYHCQEEADPTCGVVCNSSICMTRRGMRPTGAAADEARARGYRSVCHWIKARLLARAAAAAGGAVAGAAGGEAVEVGAAEGGGGADGGGEAVGAEEGEGEGAPPAAAVAVAPAAADAAPERRRSARRQQQ